jgi:hypothetical protein
MKYRVQPMFEFFRNLKLHISPLPAARETERHVYGDVRREEK